MILVYLGRWSYRKFQDDNNIFYKMKNDLTTGTWQDNIWCPIIIILLCTSDEAAAREVPGVVERESAQQVAVRKVPGVVERKSAQQAAAREVPGVVEQESVQWAVAREELAVWERESRQRVAARLDKTFKMPCKHIQLD